MRHRNPQSAIRDPKFSLSPVALLHLLRHVAELDVYLVDLLEVLQGRLAVGLDAPPQIDEGRILRVICEYLVIPRDELLFVAGPVGQFLVIPVPLDLDGASAEPALAGTFGNPAGKACARTRCTPSSVPR